MDRPVNMPEVFATGDRHPGIIVGDTTIQDANGRSSIWLIDTVTELG